MFLSLMWSEDEGRGTVEEDGDLDVLFVQVAEVLGQFLSQRGGTESTIFFVIQFI